MNLNNAKYWYDQDGNKISASDVKGAKYNKSLEYLLSDNPEDVFSKKGLKVRKAIHPLLLKVLKLTTKNKWVILNGRSIATDRKIIYAPTHGFRDDIALGLVAAKTHSYVVFASLPDFFNSIDGYALWANGVYLMDRKDPDSKKSLMSKIKYGFDNGVESILFYPEGTWNKDPNQIVLDLWKGIYKIAIDNNAIVVPIAMLNKDMNLDEDQDKTCYAYVGEQIDPKEYLSEEEFLTSLRDKMATDKYTLMDQYSHAKRKDIGNADIYWDNYISELIDTSNGFYDYPIENNSAYIDKTKVNESDVFNCMTKVKPSKENAYVLSRTLNIPKKKKEYFQKK